MHGTIIHYDPLTQCGLLRTEAGQVQYFRLDEVSSEGPVVAGQPVTLRNGVLVDTGGSQLDASLPVRPPQKPAIKTDKRTGQRCSSTFRAGCWLARRSAVGGSVNFAYAVGR